MSNYNQRGRRFANFGFLPSGKIHPAFISNFLKNTPEGFLDRLNYPKDSIALFVRSDHNVDNSSAILREWIGNVESFYHDVDVYINDTSGGYPGEKNSMDWSDQRMEVRSDGDVLGEWIDQITGWKCVLCDGANYRL